MATEAENRKQGLARLRERVRNLETCARITSLLTGELDHHSLLESIMKTAQRVLKADACSLLLEEPERQGLSFRVALGRVSDKIKTLGGLRPGEGIAGTVARTGRAVVVKDAYKHPKFNPEFDQLTGFQTGSMLCAPLKSQGRLLGVCQVIRHRRKGKVFSRDDLVLFRMVCDCVAVALQNAVSVRLLIDNQRMEKDMTLAHLVQQDFLPAETPQVPGFQFAARMVPARTVGGDFYDFIPLDPGRLAIVVGDVSGKGFSAALHMARLMSDFRFIAQSSPEPRKVLGRINDLLCARVKRGSFTTAVYALLDMKRRTLRVANAGHPPLILQTGEISERGRAGGMPLGILPNISYEQEDIPLPPNSRVLLYTDGLTEAKNQKGIPFGLKRLYSVLIQDDTPPQALAAELDRSVMKFMGNAPQFDDRTFLVFQVLCNLP